MTYDAVKKRSVMTLSYAKKLLRIRDEEDDVEISFLLEEAKDAADSYLNNPFLKTDECGEPLDPPVEESIPMSVERGILELVRAGLAAESLSLEEEKAGGRTRHFRADVLALIEENHWLRHRLCPGR